jgi:phage terminase large subunit-like protein
MTKYIPHRPTAKQAAFLLLPHREAFFGGAAGSGKTDALLMAALQYVDVPGYAAMLFRRTYADLALPGALMDRAAEWLHPTDAHWNGTTKTWHFPSGASLSFGYLETEKDKYRYQGMELHFCVEVGTLIRMADGGHKAVDEIRVGDMVETLEGARMVTCTHAPRWDSCVTAKVYYQDRFVGENIFPVNHSFLTPAGWLSYADLLEQTPIEYHASGNRREVSASLYQESCTPVESKRLDQSPAVAQFPQSYQETCRPGYAAYLADDQTYNVDRLAECLDTPSPLWLSVPVVLRAPVLPSSEAEDCGPLSSPALDKSPYAVQHSGIVYITCSQIRRNAWQRQQWFHAPEWLELLRRGLDESLSHWNAGYGERARREFPDFQDGYLADSCSCGERARMAARDGLSYRRRLSGAAEPILGALTSDAPWRTPLHSPSCLSTYRHPYTKELRSVQGLATYGEALITPVGIRQVIDLTVSDVNHYITETGLIHKNCAFDELTQFVESQYLYLFSRLRRLEGSNVPLRMRAASNPGGAGHAFVYERFVAAGKPPDRVFIPAKLEDNPYLDQDEYRLSLINLDDITRAQLLEGLWITDPAGKPFKREFWANGRNRYHIDDSAIKNKVVARYISFDTAMKEKSTSAYTACVVGELWSDYRVGIREVWRDKLEFPDLPDAILRMANLYNQDGKARAILVEDKSSGTSAYQTLMRSAPAWVKERLIAFQPSGEKLQRWSQAAVWAKRDCIQLPYPSEDTPWLYDFEQEVFSVPESLFLDQADSLAQLIIYLEHLIADGWQAREGNFAMREAA